MGLQKSWTQLSSETSTKQYEYVQLIHFAAERKITQLHKSVILWFFFFLNKNNKVLASKMRKGQRGKKSQGCSSRIWKRQGKDYPLELPEETGSASTLVSAQWNPFGTSDLQTVRMHLCCFKPQSLLWFVFNRRKPIPSAKLHLLIAIQEIFASVSIANELLALVFLGLNAQESFFQQI